MEGAFVFWDVIEHCCIVPKFEGFLNIGSDIYILSIVEETTQPAAKLRRKELGSTSNGLGATIGVPNTDTIEILSMGSNDHPLESSMNVDKTATNVIANDWQLKVISKEVHAKYIINAERLR